jgi:hypothetical protein
VSVLVNELNDRRAVFKSMSMRYSGLDDHLHLASQCPVSLLQQQSVFLNWNNVICIPADMQQWDAGSSQWLQLINRAQGFLRQSLLIRHPVNSQQFLHFGIAAFTGTLAQGPAAQITDWCITKDA